MEGKGGRGGGAQAFNSSMNTITTTTTTSTSTPGTVTTTTTRAASEGVFVEQPQQPQPQGLPRRRTGSHKRKASTSNNSSSSAAKRQARERSLSAIPPHIHNGPITRARQSPNKSTLAVAEASASVSAAASAAAAVVSASTSGSPHTQNPSDLSLLQVPSTSGEVINVTQESKTAVEELQAASEPNIDAEFEAIRSRDDNAHVIPTPAGWFSWTKVHPLEEHALASFFNGKSEKRTPDIYMEIRNLIVRKFHEDAKTQIEPKDLAELSVGELDARKEVMEFLDHWGLINFHPFPLSDSGMAAPDADGATKMASLIEKLYHFETVQPRQRVDSKVDLAKPAVLPSLFPESAIAEEVRPEGPSVEYHCNSCSADCSRKRFHCQKQADFDLCSDCYSNGKFDSGMSPADFILMEPAEVPGVSGGSWTDQETLLLLEALELYGENWNEIAEHVATKTKAQCILHFVQMPIEDTFLESEDDLDASLLESIVPGSTGDDSASKDAPERRESGLETNNDSTSSKNTPDTTEGKIANDNDSSVLRDAEKKDDTETTESGNATNEELPLSSAMDISKAKDASEVDLPQEMSANCALNALKEAFQAVGCLPEPGGPLSFAEAGNPVMALAAYLACLVEPDVAAASARSSLKTVSENSPGIQLAARHCFLLEDSPDGRNVIPAVESADAEMVDGETPKEENQEIENQESENQKEVNRIEVNCHENHASVSDGSEVPKSSLAIEMDEAVPEEKKSLLSFGDEEKEKSNAEKKPVGKTIPEDVISNVVKEPGDSALSGEDSPSTVKEPADMPLPTEVTPKAVKESGDSALPGEDPLSTAKESIDMQLPAEVTPNCIKESGDGLGEASQCSEVPKVEDMVSDSIPPEEKESKQTVASNVKVESEANAGLDAKKKEDCKEEKNCGLTDSKDDHNIDRIKRAAITALSAAAVKAKLLADQEEDQIQQLATYLVEKQLHKLEMKLSFFTEMEGVITKVREQMDRSRQKLYHERAQIIATRLGLPASSSRTIPPSLPNNRLAMNYANSVPKPQQGMHFQRPPVRINPNTSAPQLSSSSIPSSAAGASSRASYQDKLSSVGNN